MSKPPKRLLKKFQFKTEKDLPYCAVSLADTTQNKIGTWYSVKPVIDYSKCISCFICWKFCPEPAIFIEGDKVNIDYDYCKGCGICIELCPKKAVQYRKDKK